jgi:hypothetical protein
MRRPTLNESSWVNWIYDLLFQLILVYLKQKHIRSLFSVRMMAPTQFPFSCRWFIRPFSTIESPVITIQERMIETLFSTRLVRLVRDVFSDERSLHPNHSKLYWIRDFSSCWISYVLEMLASLALDEKGQDFNSWFNFDRMLDQLKYLPGGCKPFFSRWLQKLSVYPQEWRRRWKIFIV